MRQIPINQAKSLLKQVLKEKNNQRVNLLTNKKDRSLTITIKDGEVTLIEQGYINATSTYLINGDAKHELTKAFKREFPRSHQLYVSYGEI